MQSSNYQRYLQTSTYTYAGAYKDYFLSLPEDIPAIGRLVCDQITHPSMYFLPPSEYLEDRYFGKFSAYPKHRFKDEDELFITASAMTAEIFRLEPAGFTSGKDVTKRITVSCRHASVLFSAILKAKGIPCRSRAGFMDFGDEGTSFGEHWVNEYWNDQESRWVLVDADGYYEYEDRFGYSQFDLPRRKFIPAAEAWLGLRRQTLDKKIDLFTPNLLQGICEYLFMDFHTLMNNEIFYSHQPKYLRGRFDALSEPELQELDHLAELLLNPDKNISKIEQLWESNDKFTFLTNPTQNEYHDAFETE